MMPNFYVVGHRQVPYKKEKTNKDPTEGTKGKGSLSNRMKSNSNTAIEISESIPSSETSPEVNPLTKRCNITFFF